MIWTPSERHEPGKLTQNSLRTWERSSGLDFQKHHYHHWVLTIADACLLWLGGEMRKGELLTPPPLEFFLYTYEFGQKNRWVDPICCYIFEFWMPSMLNIIEGPLNFLYEIIWNDDDSNIKSIFEFWRLNKPPNFEPWGTHLVFMFGTWIGPA